jgi:hypothetical protein
LLTRSPYDSRAFLHHVALLRQKRWLVHAKPPFSGPKAVLAYLPRYTHPVRPKMAKVYFCHGSPEGDLLFPQQVRPSRNLPAR